ncbi:MAG: DUF1800 domain-containing protein [Cyclobacteriaceae bacterium]
MDRKENNSLEISKFSGEWTQRHASHLLRRTLFGPKISELKVASTLGLDATVERLFETQSMPSPPLNSQFDGDPNTPIGETWINNPFVPGSEFHRKKSFRSWWLNQIRTQSMSIREKMVLFWSNHFAIELDVANDTRGAYELNDLYRKRATGNFRTLVEEVTVSQAMLIYLNGNTNRNGAPNENYARELLELFSIGKGPLIGEGNYTNYTEDDIQEAARVLSGFRTEKNPDKKVYYVTNRHDKGQKVFSSAFDNQVIENEEDEEYKTLIGMIFSKEETAKHICRKLYRWFMFYDISDEIEEKIIAPMATSLRDNNFEISAPLKLLLSSEHFYDTDMMGAYLKSPVEFNAGFLRQLEVEFPDESLLKAYYNLHYSSYQSQTVQQQNLTDPPDVAGWKAYYQAPAYNRGWISPTTLSERGKFIDKLLGSGYKNQGEIINVNPLNILKQLDKPEDPNVVVSGFADLLLPVPISTDELEELKEALIPGLPDFEWTVEYEDYANDPNNSTKKSAIQSKLLSMLKVLTANPSLHLI